MFQILLQDGYFVHFFAPPNLPPLPKQVVFVLDTSGSMDGRKIDQLKHAMNSILNELKDADVFSIVEFNYNAKTWDIDNNYFVSFPEPDGNDYNGESQKNVNVRSSFKNISISRSFTNFLTIFSGCTITCSLRSGFQKYPKGQRYY